MVARIDETVVKQLFGQATMDAVVYHPVTLVDFVHFTLLKHEVPTTLVVCMHKQAFVEHLQRSIDLITTDGGSRAQSIAGDAEDDEDAVPSEEEMPKGPHPLLEPTLAMLSTAHDISVVFCPSVRVLHAYLATLVLKAPESSRERTSPMLALVNPVLLHSQTGSYSAQALSSTFSAAMEGALRSGQQLVVMEASDQLHTPQQAQPGEDNDEVGEVEGRVPDAEVDSDLWERQLPVLSSTTRTFGLGGDRGWLGRTVSLRDVIRRICLFLPLEHTYS